MAAKRVTTTVKQPDDSAGAVDVSFYCRDLDQWPRSWMGVEQDLPPGQQLLPYFRRFIEHLASSSLSSKTIRRHVDNLWSLGGEIIRHLHYDRSLRKLPADRLLNQAIHEYGGPAIHNGSDDQQRSFDSTCRKLHRFLFLPPT
jgi:hypothetical protein